MNIEKVRAALLVAFVLVGTAGCASGGGSTAPTSAAGQTATASMPMESSSAAPAAASAITIKDFAYGDPISVSPGATVTVTNMDTAEHTVTADQGSAFDVEVKGSGGTATFTAPSQPGTYTFHCTYHPNMHGTLTVK
jgi:plastocyanin